MAIDPQLKSFMPHTVTISAFTQRNAYGEEAYGTSRTASAYVEPNTTLDAGNQVNEERRSTTAYVADTSITVQDKITLPDGTTPEIASIQKHDEVAGLEHTVVTFR